MKKTPRGDHQFLSFWRIHVHQTLGKAHPTDRTSSGAYSNWISTGNASQLRRKLSTKLGVPQEAEAHHQRFDSPAALHDAGMLLRQVGLVVIRQVVRTHSAVFAAAKHCTAVTHPCARELAPPQHADGRRGAGKGAVDICAGC